MEKLSTRFASCKAYNFKIDKIFLKGHKSEVNIFREKIERHKYSLLNNKYQRCQPKIHVYCF